MHLLRCRRYGQSTQSFLTQSHQCPANQQVIKEFAMINGLWRLVIFHIERESDGVGHCLCRGGNNYYIAPIIMWGERICTNTAIWDSGLWLALPSLPYMARCLSLFIETLLWADGLLGLIFVSNEWRVSHVTIHVNIFSSKLEFLQILLLKSETHGT